MRDKTRRLSLHHHDHRRWLFSSSWVWVLDLFSDDQPIMFSNWQVFPMKFSVSCAVCTFLSLSLFRCIQHSHIFLFSAFICRPLLLTLFFLRSLFQERQEKDRLENRIKECPLSSFHKYNMRLPFLLKTSWWDCKQVIKERDERRGSYARYCFFFRSLCPSCIQTNVFSPSLSAFLKSLLSLPLRRKTTV